MNTTEIREACRLIKQGMNILDGGPLEWYVERLSRCYDFLLTLAPHQPGDRVRLTRAPVIDEREAPGWLSAKHVLVVGAVATVKHVTSDGTGFRYGLEFDGESWISHQGVEHVYAPEERHVYSFGAESFESIETGRKLR